MNALTADLLEFLDNSPCNFLAVKNLSDKLDATGFEKLDMRDAWDIKTGGRYYVTKNNSAIFAFVAGAGSPEIGYRIICAHSDSPGFRIKPNAEMTCSGNVLKLNTEVYGGPILYTWFDRPLSIAGRVILRGASALEPETRLIRFTRPLLTIPHLAIHYNRSVNEGNPLSKQRDMLPVMAILNDKSESNGYLLNLVATELGVNTSDILDFDLTLYDTTPASLFGVGNEFISAGRIDDLEMAHCAASALIGSLTNPTECTATRVMAIFDNEETGSGTKQGAASPVLKTILQRINQALGGNDETFSRAVASSFMISADNGHAIHPNYESKQDPTKPPGSRWRPRYKNQCELQIYDRCRVSRSVPCDMRGSGSAGADICQPQRCCRRLYARQHPDIANRPAWSRYGGAPVGNALLPRNCRSCRPPLHHTRIHTVLQHVATRVIAHRPGQFTGRILTFAEGLSFLPLKSVLI